MCIKYTNKQHQNTRETNFANGPIHLKVNVQVVINTIPLRTWAPFWTRTNKNYSFKYQFGYTKT